MKNPPPHTIVLAAAAAFLFCLVRPLSAQQPPEPPNIVFILADDLGYGDLSCYGAPDVQTPNIDSLARDGVKFTNCYAMGPECTPSRTAIMTGRYPKRAGGMECAIGTGNVGRYDDAIALAERGELGLPPDLAMLAPGLKSAGYTNAVFGKWHLGYEPKFHPFEQGFDAFTGFLGGNVEYFRHYELSDLDVYLKGREPVERDGYLTDLITDDGVDFLNRQAGRPEPFFLFLSHAAPHFPFQGPDERDPEPTAENWTQGTRDSYTAMIESLDRGVGRVLKALEANGQAERTIVVFTSDHGAMMPGRNEPWRDFKGTLFEGGIRVPCLVRRPGVFAPGSVSDQVAGLMDLTHSFLNVAGGEVPDGGKLDGIDILKHVAEGRPDLPRQLFWRYRRGNRTWRAVRDGDLKLISDEDGDEQQTWLFDLAADPTETRELSGQRADDYRRLTQLLQGWEEATVPMRPIETK